MGARVDFDRGMDTTMVVITLQEDGSFRVGCSPDVDVETLLALDRDLAHQIVDAVLALRRATGHEGPA